MSPTIYPRTGALVLLLCCASSVVAQPQSRTHDTGPVRFEVFDNGTLGGYVNVATPEGTGFVFLGDNGLYEAQILVGRNAGQVSGAVYGFPAVEWSNTLPISAVPPPSGFDEAYLTAFDDSPASNPIGVRVVETSYSDTGDRFVIVDLVVENTTPSALTNIYVGLFADWDVLEFDFDDDLGDYRASEQLLYVYDVTGSPSTKHFGVAALDGASVSGWDLSVGGTMNPTESDLYNAMTNGGGTVPVAAGDRRTVLGTGPYTLQPGASTRVKFAFVGGTSEADLIANAQAAQAAASAPAPTVSVVPVNGPIVIPGGGGSFSFRATFTNPSSQPAVIEVWTEASGAISQSPVLGPRTITLPPSASITRLVQQFVPAPAPAGFYDYTVNIGDFPLTVVSSGSFQLVKQGSARAPAAGLALGPVEWGEASGASAVTGWEPVLTVQPNPASGPVRFAFSTDSAADVRLAVYDVLGRELAVLAEGFREGGPTRRCGRRTSPQASTSPGSP